MIEGHPAEHVAVISRGRETTYGSLREQVANTRSRLAALGVADGDRVALLIGNNRHFVVSYLAVLGVGGVAVPLNPTSPANEIERELVAVGATTVVVGPTAVPSWRSVEQHRVP